MQKRNQAPNQVTQFFGPMGTYTQDEPRPNKKVRRDTLLQYVAPVHPASGPSQEEQLPTEGNVAGWYRAGLKNRW